jgi:hypothetical protein
MAMSPRLLRPILSGDPDALRYIAAVQQADQQSLEPAVRKAITDFIVGCKQDGIWSGIKASCILMGARTLSGALTPLVGSAPTNNGPFVSGDYNRKLGLTGDGTTKYIDTNRALNADPQNSFHMSVYITTVVNNADYMGDFAANNGNLLQCFNNTHFAYARSAGAVARGAVTGFFGATRATSSAFTARGSASDSTNSSSTSVSPPSRNAFVFARNNPTGVSSFSSGRMTFYSMGESLTLSLLDTRVTNLYNAIGAAI